MKREITFRGKRCKDGRWVYGSYVESHSSWNGCKPHKSWIVPSPMTNGGWFSIRGAYPVKEETVCQYTGLQDKNGKDIYEGDIIRWYSLQHNDYGPFEEPDSYIEEHIDVVVFDDGVFCTREDLELHIKYLTDDYRNTNPDENIFEYTHNLDEYPFIKNENDLCYCEVCGNVYDNPNMLK